MISEWIICPICGNKTRDRVMEDSRHAWRISDRYNNHGAKA